MKEKGLTSKPELNNSFAQKELDKAEAQFEQFNEQVKNLTLDRMNEAPKEEREMQTKLSSRELSQSNALYLKPKRSISSKEKFNEKFRQDYNFMCERVDFVAENYEIIGESIDLWTKPFAGMPAEEWEVPVNKPVNGPRYLAEQIKKCSYHRLRTEDHRVSNLIGTDGMGSYTGQLIVDQTVARLDAHPINSGRKSVFMGVGR